MPPSTNTKRLATTTATATMTATGRSQPGGGDLIKSSREMQAALRVCRFYCAWSQLDAGLGPFPMIALLLLSVQVSSTTIVRDAHGRIKRSAAVRREFRRVHPCPITGLTYGRCPSYVIDHVVAPECGGPDAVSNMQWQTVTDAKIKDRTERLCRLPR